MSCIHQRHTKASLRSTPPRYCIQTRTECNYHAERNYHAQPSRTAQHTQAALACASNGHSTLAHALQHHVQRLQATSDVGDAIIMLLYALQVCALFLPCLWAGLGPHYLVHWCIRLLMCTKYASVYVYIYSRQRYTPIQHTHDNYTHPWYPQGTGKDVRAHAQQPGGWVSTAQRALRCLERTTVEEQDHLQGRYVYFFPLLSHIYITKI